MRVKSKRYINFTFNVPSMVQYLTDVGWWGFPHGYYRLYPTLTMICERGIGVTIACGFTYLLM